MPAQSRPGIGRSILIAPNLFSLSEKRVFNSPSSESDTPGARTISKRVDWGEATDAATSAWIPEDLRTSAIASATVCVSSAVEENGASSTPSGVVAFSQALFSILREAIFVGGWELWLSSSCFGECHAHLLRHLHFIQRQPGRCYQRREVVVCIRIRGPAVLAAVEDVGEGGQTDEPQDDD